MTHHPSAAVSGPSISSRLWLWLWRFLGSVRLAVILLVGLAVVMAVGTVIESRHSATEARELVYGTLWFDSFMFLMAVNLLVAVAHRWPVPWHKWPFVVTHLAIVMLLVGCWISRHYGIEGQINIEEGETTGILLLSGTELHVSESLSGATFQSTLPSRVRAGTDPLVGTARTSDSSPLDWKVRVAEVVPAGQPHTVVREELGSSVAGIEICLHAGNNHQCIALLDGQPGPSRRSLGSLELEFQDARDPQVFAALDAPQEPPSVVASYIKAVRAGETENAIEIPLTQEATSQATDLGDGCSVRVLKSFQRAVVSGRELAERDQGPLNPAAIVEVCQGDQRETHFLFAMFPKFNMVRERVPETGAPLPVDLQYVNTATESGTLVRMLRGPDEKLYLKVEQDGVPSELQPIAVGEVMSLPGLHIDLQIDRFIPTAALDTAVEPVPKDNGREYFLVELSTGAGTDTAWLTRGYPEKLNLGQESFELLLRSPQYELPFTLALEEFQARRYAGSSMPSAFESRVKVDVPAENSALSATIAMNRPLDVAGFRLFQSSYVEGKGGAPNRSILTVSKDPGVPVVYLSIGILILSVGAYVVTAWGGFARRRSSAPSAPMIPSIPEPKRAKVPCASGRS